MSGEAIRAMEGIELAHVQARIQCLRNVRSLLDASMTQMEQYVNIVSTQRLTNFSTFPFIFNSRSFFIVIWEMVFVLILMSIKYFHHQETSIQPQQIVSLLMFRNDLLFYLNSVDENDTDLIRRRRLDHYANRMPSSIINEDNNDG
jgi:hypothetical protein